MEFVSSNVKFYSLGDHGVFAIFYGENRVRVKSGGDAVASLSRW